MQNPNSRLRAGWRMLATVIVVCASWGSVIAQSTKPPQQPLNLPDPTPRPPDLEKRYATDPEELARQQRLALLRAAQIRQQVIGATNKLLILTLELKADVEKRENNAAMTPQVVKAEQIEKLAKTVKEKTQAQ